MLTILLLFLNCFLPIALSKCGFSSSNETYSRYSIIKEAWNNVIQNRLDTELFVLPTAEHRLVGGQESFPHAWPWTGQILINGRHLCGCALVDPEFVLTAAHCFSKSRNPLRYKVLLGGHKIYTGKSYALTKISIHNLYQIRASAYDLALVKIFPPVNISDKLNTVCLPQVPINANQMCVVTGWGRLMENGERSETLREIHVPIIPIHVCNSFKHYAGRVHSGSMMCAGYNNGLMDSCQGDSGGPLQCRNPTDGSWELQGVVSWGIGCANPSYPGVYTKIQPMVHWINRQIVLDKKDKK